MRVVERRLELVRGAQRLSGPSRCSRAVWSREEPAGEVRAPPARGPVGSAAGPGARDRPRPVRSRFPPRKGSARPGGGVRCCSPPGSSQEVRKGRAHRSARRVSSSSASGGEECESHRQRGGDRGDFVICTFCPIGNSAGAGTAEAAALVPLLPASRGSVNGRRFQCPAAADQLPRGDGGGRGERGQSPPEGGVPVLRLPGWAAAGTIPALTVWDGSNGFDRCRGLLVGEGGWNFLSGFPERGVASGGISFARSLRASSFRCSKPARSRTPLG